MMIDDSSWMVLSPFGRSDRTIRLSTDITVGRDIGAEPTPGHVTIEGDAKVSRLAAMILRQPVGWCVQAPQATNGLFVNGERLAEGAVRLLRSGDEIRLGDRSRLMFHSHQAVATDRSRTEVARPAPALTVTERQVLVSLCLPLLEGDAFTPAASVGAIARRLFVTESAVRQHLGRLYLKFEIAELPERRSRLANEAVQRGVVRRADLEETMR